MTETVQGHSHPPGSEHSPYDHLHEDGVRHAHDHDHDDHHHDHDGHHNDHDEFFHDHHGEELTPEDASRLEHMLWKLENVEMTTVGVDVGSSTSHLMFARVHMQRRAHAISSRFVVVHREVLWRSPICLTPYVADDTIDAERLGSFVADAYEGAGLARADVDSGAVILTGEALKRKNARAIADLFAEESGKFVCASAGHHMEAMMAAHGSGAAALSRAQGDSILNVDIGGGTSKLALIGGGEVLATAAIAVGGRLAVRTASGEVVRVEGPARLAAEAAGVSLGVGTRLAPDDERRLVLTWCDALVSLIRDAAGLPPHPTKLATTDALIAKLLVTEPLAGSHLPRAISFSGGVAEYLYGREAGDYDDFGRTLAAELKHALADGRIPLPVVDPGQGIRATVIGASQFTVQVSGNTIAVSNDDMLPLRNLPVAYPRVDLAADPTAEAISVSVRAAHERLDLTPGHDSVALAFRWIGDPLYARLRRLAEGIRDALPGNRRLPIVLLFDRDVGRLVGDILRRDLHLDVDVVSVDGMQLKEFDYVDIGEIVRPNRVVPVVIKSLLFSADGKQT